MKQRKVVAYTYLILGIILCLVFAGRFLPFDSYGAEDIKITIGNELNKYINYYLSEQDKGTLVQYEMNTKIEYGKEILPVKQKEIIVNLSQIEGKYPNQVKVMHQDSHIEVVNQYDASMGRLLIQGDSKKQQEGYLVMAYYDTYTEENIERELETKVEVKAILTEEEGRPIVTEEQYNDTVTENIGQLTSIDSEVQDIFNGYIKSNVINGTNYTTQYNQNDQIVVSKKEEQDTIEMLVKDTFVRAETKGEEEIRTDLGNNQNLVYKNTQIQQSEVENLLGKQGTLEILDQEGNKITTIDENTEFNEEGMAIITYENEPEAIIIKTSNIQNEGILNLKHTKEIKNTMTDFQDVSVKTMIQLKGKQEVQETLSPIKEAKTTIDVDMSHTNWSNKQQNEITFDMYLKANEIENNMFKNPSIQIEFPSQVEKVILGDSSIMYANGLELQTPTIATNEKGNLVMTVNLSGEQTQYDENSLELITDIKIATNVILKKEIESTKEAIHVSYCNQYTIDGSIETGEKEIPIEIENYQEEIAEEANNDVFDSTIPQPLTENNDNLKLEVAPTKGETVLKEGDTVYEGEYIKYQIRVTNTSKDDINNVTVVASIPEGVTYGELETNYYDYRQKYSYNFQKELREKQIHIGTIKAEECIDTFYEVKVNDLPEGKENQIINTDMNVLVGSEFAQSYSMTNKIEHAEVQLFMNSLIDYAGWAYGVNLISDKEEEVDADIHLPKAVSLRLVTRVNHIVEDPSSYVATEEDYGEIVYESDEQVLAGKDPIRKLDLEISKDNIITTKLKTNCYYEFQVQIRNSDLQQAINKSTTELTSYIEATLDGKQYLSNENRIEIAYQNVKVSMTSPNEGEKIECEKPINYEITIQNIGGSNIANPSFPDSVSVKLYDFLPEELKPVSVTYDKWEMKTDETGINTFVKTEDITKRIASQVTDKDGNKIANVDIVMTIPKGETAKIRVETIAGFVDKETKIENSATVTGDYIIAKTTNTITHTILPYDFIPDGPDDPDEPNEPDEPDEPNNPDNPDDPNMPEQPTENKYSIAGMAWLDEDHDGERSSDEGVVNDMTVMLMDVTDANTIKSITETNEDGRYEFSNIKPGNYLVAFRYDTNNYQLTEYQKAGVSSSNNSDVVSKTINLSGEQVEVGITDTITLSKSATNIDIGLIENKLSDFKIDKYIDKVTVKTAKGTKEYNYGNKTLAKTEIRAKEIEGATVTIQYKIVITNVGEVAGIVSEIVDYLPDGLTFSKTQNSTWNKNAKGELINTSLSNRKMQAEESIELTLIATKQMTANTTGTFTNKVSITGTTEDNLENNTAHADIIISVSTGAMLYITIVIFIIAILSTIVVYLYKKGKLDLKNLHKMTFLVIFIVTTLYSCSSVFGEDIPIEEIPSEYHKAQFHYQGTNSHMFEGGPNEVGGWCTNHNLSASRNNVNFHYARVASGNNSKDSANDFGPIETRYDNEQETIEGEFTIDRLGSREIEVKSQTEKIYGPFRYSCIGKNGDSNINVQFSCEVTDVNLKRMNDSDFIICNSKGEKQDIGIGNNKEFYIKVKTDREVKRVKLIASGLVRRIITHDHWERLIYESDDTTKDWQPIITHKYIPIHRSEALPDYGDQWEEDSIEWTMMRGNLEIIKVDKSNPETKLAGVKFTMADEDGEQLILSHKNGKMVEEVEGEVDLNDYVVTRDVDQQDIATKFITDKKGKIFIRNLQIGRYEIYEVENPVYGYEDNEADYRVKKVNSGETTTVTWTNKRNLGNLLIKKQDLHNSDIILAGVSFKIKYKKDEKTQYLMLRNNKGKPIENQAESFDVEKDGIFDLTTKEEEGTTFITDKFGRIQLYNIREGEYTVIEKDLGEHKNYYHIDDEYISWIASSGKGDGNNCKVTVEKRKVGSKNRDILRIYNKRKYIDLSGYVWEDLPWQDGKETKWNDLFKGNEKDKNDKKLKGIEVRLIDSAGEQKTKDTITNEKGKYQFKKIEIDKLKDYYIEFKYNGMSYQSIAVNMEEEKGSKASEGDNREEFNKGYQTITKGKSNGHKSISYERLPYESKLLYGNKANYNYGYEGNEENRDPVSNVDAQYTIKAKTKKLNNMNLPVAIEHNQSTQTTDKISDDILNEMKELMGNSINKQEQENKTTEKKQSELLKATPTNIRENGIKEIQNINLGIRKREKIDLEVIKDIHSVRVSINDQTHVYKYADRFKNAIYEEYNDDKIKSGYDISPKIKYQKTDRYGNMSYTRAVYESDVYYNNEKEPDKNLKVEVTYQIGIRNNTAEGIKTTINELTDYYVNKYQENLKIGKKVNEDGTIQEDENTKVTKLEDQGDYKKATIATNLEVTAQKQSNLYVQLQIKPSQIKEIVGIKKEELKLYNIVEISSYSSKRKNKDNDYDIYAAIDIDSEPGNLDVNDITSYEDDTDKAPSLGIVLPEERKIQGIVFKDETEKENEVIRGEIRQGDGKYEENKDKGIDGVTVKLVKANNMNETAKRYNPETGEFEDIMATTQNGGVFELSGFIPDNYQVVYTWGDNTYKVQEYKNTIVDKEIYESKGESNLEWYKEEFKKNTIKDEHSIPEWNKDSNQEIRVSDAVDIYTEREAIDRQSSIMTYGNKTVINNYNGELKQEDETKQDIITKINAVTPTFKVKVEYFDTLPENKKEEYELVNGEIQIDEKGYVKKAEKYQHILKNIDFGIVKRAQQVLQLDKDVKKAKIILANGLVLINAEIKDGKIVNQVEHATYIPESTNKGQVKFEVDKELLQGAELKIDFGLKATNISELDYQNEEYYKYGVGHGEKEEELVQLNPQQVIDYLDNSISIGTDNQLGEIRQEQEEKNALIKNGLLEDTNAMNQLLKDTQRVLIIEKLTENLKPNENKSIDSGLKVSRLLSSAALDEGINMENIAEIIKIKKSWGAPVITTPGNYTPSASNNHEPDDSTSETVTVVPPTGLDINYIAYTLLAISSLGILVSGIILIKKFVLK